MLYLDIYTHVHIYTYLKDTLNLYTCDSEKLYFSMVWKWTDIWTTNYLSYFKIKERYYAKIMK